MQCKRTAKITALPFPISNVIGFALYFHLSIGLYHSELHIPRVLKDWTQTHTDEKKTAAYLLQVVEARMELFSFTQSRRRNQFQSSNFHSIFSKRSDARTNQWDEPQHTSFWFCL
jgi:inorganic triphosphatase YgiF